MSRAEYSRKVFVASKTGYLTKKSSTSRQAAGKGAGIGKIKFLNYVSKKRYFVLTGQSLMYHHDHNKLDDPLHSKVCASVCASVCVCASACMCVRGAAWVTGWGSSLGLTVVVVKDDGVVVRCVGDGGGAEQSRRGDGVMTVVVSLNK